MQGKWGREILHFFPVCSVTWAWDIRSDFSSSSLLPEIRNFHDYLGIKVTSLRIYRKTSVESSEANSCIFVVVTNKNVIPSHGKSMFAETMFERVTHIPQDSLLSILGSLVEVTGLNFSLIEFSFYGNLKYKSTVLGETKAHTVLIQCRLGISIFTQKTQRSHNITLLHIPSHNPEHPICRWCWTACGPQDRKEPSATESHDVAGRPSVFGDGATS